MTLREAFESKMMLLDGGMGSVIQTYGIKGANNDMLSIERPDIILDPSCHPRLDRESPFTFK